MKILIDNGHGAETRGKRSPDGRLLEYRENRIIARGIVTALAARGLDAALLVPEENDIPLPERCRRVNDWCRLLGKDHVILISIHSNAAGRGDRWLSARGWCAYTTRGATRADALEKDFYVLRHTLCPSVLVENLFMDNPSDCAFLLSEEGQQSLVDLHVDGICDYKSQILIWPKPNL